MQNSHINHTCPVLEIQILLPGQDKHENPIHILRDVIQYQYSIIVMISVPLYLRNDRNLKTHLHLQRKSKGSSWNFYTG